MTEQKTVYNEYDLKAAAKIQKAISGLFPDYNNNYTDEEILKKSFCVVDLGNVAAIEPKTDTAKLLLKPFVDPEDGFKDPTAYKIEHDFLKAVETGVYISSEYTLKAVKILDSCKEAFKIYSKKDYPLMLENEHFKIIIAPRIEAD